MGGRRIDDREGFAGAQGPQGVKVKSLDSASSAGSLNTYEDTEPQIKAAQNITSGKMKSHSRKEHYRN